MKTIAPFMKYILLALGLAFIAIGIAGEEYFAVLQKAIRVCLECIGIG